MIRAGVRALSEMYALTRGLRNMRVFLVSYVAAALASGLLSPILPQYLESRGLDIARIGFVFTLGSLIPIAIQPLLGALSDRMNRATLVASLSLVTSLFVPLLALLHGPLPVSAALATKLTLERSSDPMCAAMVADFAAREERATVLGVLSSATNLMFVAALVLSSVAFAWLGLESTFFLAGALFVVSSLVLFALRDTRGAGDAGDVPAAATAKAPRFTFAPFAHAARAPSLFAYQFFFSFALDLFPIYVPLSATHLGASPSAVGPLVAASWLVYAIVQPIGGRLSDRLAQRGESRRGLIVLGLGGMAACGVLIGLAHLASGPIALWLFAGAWVLMAIPDGLFRPSAEALLLDVAPDGERGAFLGAMGSAVAAANVVAPLAYGLIARRFDLGAAFVVSAAALVVATLIIGRAGSFDALARAEAGAAGSTNVS